MKKYQKGTKILTQKELKESAKNKSAVWVEYRLPDPSDKLKEMNRAIIPCPFDGNDGFYLGDVCWDNVDDDNEKCFSEGFDGEILSIYKAI